MDWNHRSAIWVSGMLLVYSVIFDNELLVLAAALVACLACYLFIPEE